jgi:hypothetical protein
MKKLFALLIVLFAGVYAYSQEIQIPVDTDGKMESISEEFNKMHNIFTEYENFYEARLFQSGDNEFYLEVTQKQNDRLVRTKVLMTEQDVANLRQRVSYAMLHSKHKKESDMAMDKSARSWLIASYTTVGAAYYGWVVPVVLEVDGGAAVGLYMVTTASCFLIPFFLTNRYPVTQGTSIMTRYGLERGIGHGMLISTLTKNPEAKSTLLFGMFGSLSEGFALNRWAKHTEMTAGKASTIRSIGDVGVAVGLGLGYLLTDYEDFRQVSGSILLGAAGGMFAGSYMADVQNYTLGDASLLYTGAILGGAVVTTGLILGNSENPRFIAGMLTAGVIGGVAGIHYLTKNHDFETDEGNFIQLATTAGALIGAGVGLIAGFDNTKVFVTTTTLSALAGFGIMTNYYLKNGESKKRGKHVSMDMSIMPYQMMPYEMGLLPTQHKSQLLPGAAFVMRF